MFVRMGSLTRRSTHSWHPNYCQGKWFMMRCQNSGVWKMETSVVMSMPCWKACANILELEIWRVYLELQSALGVFIKARVFGEDSEEIKESRTLEVGGSDRGNAVTNILERGCYIKAAPVRCSAGVGEGGASWTTQYTVFQYRGCLCRQSLQ